VASFVDVCRFTATSSGTGDFVVSALVTGYQTPASAGAVNGAIYRYRAENAALTEWEVGYGAYTVGSVTLARTVVLFNSLGTTAKISFTAAPQVGIVALGEDIVNQVPPQGRLTLATGIAVMTSTVTAATTVYYTLSMGNLCPIYDGSNFVITQFAEISQVTTDTTKSPAAATTNSNYDVFVWNDAGTIRATRGPLWTSNTARGTGAGTTELVLTKGIYLNANSITNGPAASRGTYVGTIRTNGTSTVDYIIGGTANGGVAGSLGVWNMYNRNLAVAQSIDNTSYTYSTGAIRQAHASTGNQISVLAGLNVDTITVNWLGIGEDSTTTFASIGTIVQTPSAAIMVAVASPSQVFKVPLLGFHTYSANEAGDGTNANTVNSSSAATLTMTVWN